MSSLPASVTTPPVFLEFPGRGDSYSDCFCPALADAGAVVREGNYSGRWLLQNIKHADFAHFHWPSFYYASPNAFGAIRKAVKFAAILLWIRLTGVRILWTAHNLYPHERNSPVGIDFAVRKFLILLCDRIFVHGTTARSALTTEFGVNPQRLVSIDHGNFLEHYAMQVTQADARHKLGLPSDARVFGFVGNCRPYKNLVTLIRAFQHHFPEAWLVIAGKCSDADYRRQLEQTIAEAPARILFEPRYIADEELQYFIRATDVIVLPFKEVLTSGSAILALSFGRAVVAPGLGHLLDIIGEETGVLYDPKEGDGLVRGMHAALVRRFNQEKVMRHAATLRWQDAAATVLAVARQKYAQR